MMQFAREQNLKADKRGEHQVELLEKILDTLNTIRDHQELMKEAMLYAPEGPGAKRACCSFHKKMNGSEKDDESEEEHWMSRGRH